MPKLSDLLNQITSWIKHYNSEYWHKVKLDSGLSRDRIEAYLEGKPFTFPEEVFELYNFCGADLSSSKFIVISINNATI
jgi:hypothetical protein